MSRSHRVLLVATLCALVACESDDARLAKAAAADAASAKVIGPNDVQIMSADRTVALEVVGDSVNVYLQNTVVSVPATYIENIKYLDNRLRFDIKGIGVKIFDVGDGREGAVFRPQDALLFVSTVMERQNAIEHRK
jgi:hypothetical protein